MGLFTSNIVSVYLVKWDCSRQIDLYFFTNIFLSDVFSRSILYFRLSQHPLPPIRRKNSFFISDGADYSCATFLYSIRKEKTNSKNLRDLFIDQKMRFFKVTALEGRIIILRVLSFSVFKL